MKTTQILAAVDRFPEDDAVLLRGIGIAQRHGAALTVVHIVDLPDHAAAPAVISTARGQAEMAARTRIEAALLRLEIDLAEVEIHIDTGVPSERLITLCDAIKPMLLVMRAHQKPWIVKALLGSTTQKLAGSGAAPVLVVRSNPDRPYGRVLLAIDGPDTAPTALSFVSGLLPEAELHMVQAVEVPPHLEQAMLRVGMGQTHLMTHHDMLAQAAETRLKSLADGLATPVTWQVLRGDPAEKLVHTTKAPDVDLIVLGPNRSSLLRRVFIGSVTRRLLRDAGCDVLIARPLDASLSEGLEQPQPTAAHAASNLPPVAL